MANSVAIQVYTNFLESQYRSRVKIFTFLGLCDRDVSGL